MKFKNMGFIVAAGVVMFLMAGNGLVWGLPLGPFVCITNNNAGDCGIGSAQLSGDITGNVLTLTMTGTTPAVVEQVNIESSVVSSISSVASVGNGIVDFTPDASPVNLPGGNSIGFVSAASASADPPAPRNGIGWQNQDQTSGQSGAFTLVLSGLLDPIADFRVGVHVISFASGGSESFVSTPVPEPSTALLLGTGLLGLAFWGRKRLRS